LLKDWTRSKISSLELAALGAEEKTRLTGEIDQFSAELEARLNEIISLLQPPRLACWWGRKKIKNGEHFSLLLINIIYLTSARAPEENFGR